MGASPVEIIPQFTSPDPLIAESPFPLHWLFFADDQRPMSMRMVLAMRLAESDPVVIIESAVSVRRTRRIPRLKHRVSRIAQAKAGWHYHPLHFPEGIPGFSGMMKSMNCRQLQRELQQIVPEGGMRIACYDSPSQYYLAGTLGEHRSIYLAVDDRTRTVWGEPISGEIESEKEKASSTEGIEINPDTTKHLNQLLERIKSPLRLA